MSTQYEAIETSCGHIKAWTKGVPVDDSAIEQLRNVAGLPFNIKHILTDAPLRRRGDQNLYNLEADPYELNDLSQEPEHQAKLKDFQNEVFKWWEETGGALIPGPHCRAWWRPCNRDP